MLDTTSDWRSGRSRRETLGLAGEAWLAHLRDDRRLSTDSVKTYRSQLLTAFRKLPADYSSVDLSAAMDRRLGHHVSTHTRRNAYIALEGFFRWWERRGGGPNPLADMAPPAKSTARRRALTPVEQELLGARLETAAPKDRCEVLLLLLQGFRVGDVVALMVEDVDVDGMRIRCRNGKGGTDTWLPMGPTVAEALRGYLETSRITAGHVFTGPNGPMRTQSIWKAWRRVAGPRLAGLAPHQLRHTFATLLIRGQSRPDVNTVRKLMRHRNLATTQLYFTDDEDLERGAIISLDLAVAQLRAGKLAHPSGVGNLPNHRERR